MPRPDEYLRMPVPDWRKSAIPSRDFPSRDFPSRDRKGAVLAVRELAPPNFAGRKMLLCHIGIDLNAEARLVLNG